MNSQRGRLAVSFIASIGINVLVIIPMLASDLGAAGTTEDLGEVVTIPDFQDQPNPDEVKLGIDESDASTLTWIGYEQYQEHMARLAELDQAQFQIGGGATGGGGSPNPPAPEPRPPTPETPPSQPAPEPAPDTQAEPLPQQPPLPEFPSPDLPKPADTDAIVYSIEDIEDKLYE